MPVPNATRDVSLLFTTHLASLVAMAVVTRVSNRLRTFSRCRSGGRGTIPWPSYSALEETNTMSHKYFQKACDTKPKDGSACISIDSEAKAKMFLEGAVLFAREKGDTDLFTMLTNSVSCPPRLPPRSNQRIHRFPRIVHA